MTKPTKWTKVWIFVFWYVLIEWTMRFKMVHTFFILLRSVLEILDVKGEKGQCNLENDVTSCNVNKTT